jgi:hypothetical protein
MGCLVVAGDPGNQESFRAAHEQVQHSYNRWSAPSMARAVRVRWRVSTRAGPEGWGIPM